MRYITAAAAAALLASPAALHGQTLREYSSTRQDRGEPRLNAIVKYAGGELRMMPAPSGILYALRLTYDADRFSPVVEFDAAAPRLILGTEAVSGGIARASHTSTPPAATIALGTQADLDLDIQLGAAKATIELGGNRVSRLRLETGASQTTLSFSESNPIRCSSAVFTAGAAELLVKGLGHARCSTIDFKGGVGKTTLDFSGTWSGQLHLTAQVAMGEVVLRLPRKAGIRLELDRFLSSFAPAGLTKSADGKTWSSAGFDAAPEQLVVDLEAAIGGVSVEWIE
jgi:hypothetical protein